MVPRKELMPVLWGILQKNVQNVTKEGREYLVCSTKDVLEAAAYSDDGKVCFSPPALKARMS